jgi:tetratricopeptide (TPR) repeat protein
MKNLVLSFLLFTNIFCFSQDSLEFEFDKSRALLAQRKVEDAINSLRKIYVVNPENANINFLMGAAYAETSGKEKEAIFHLKKALPFVTEKYIVGSFKETNAPIHTYYYLTKSFVELDRCAEARLALNKLKKFNKFIDDYFIAEGERNMQKCPFDPEDLKIELTAEEIAPVGYNPKELKKELTVDSAELARRGIFTKKLNYTTKSSLYGVQIGSNKNPVPVSSFGQVNNVDVFVDTDGIIRYVVGHFSYRKQAEKLLESIYSKGYNDAFIVNVNNERKYSNEVISYQNINLKAGIIGDVQFFIQLGAFQQEIPDSIINLYHDIKELHEVPYNDMTLLLVGPYSKYQESDDMKKKLHLNGVNSFIVAFNNRKKIPLKEAINHAK